MQIQDINKIGVLGAGVMGGGIAQSAIQAGYNVIIRDLTVEICENARETILNSRFGFNNAVQMDKMSAEERDAAMERLSITTEVNDLKDFDLIIEAIGGGIDGAIENKPLKLEVWKEMDQVVKPEAVFASNTSMFTIADLAEVTTRKDRFIGMHLFSPANIMKLVEVTHTEETSEEVTNQIVELSKSMGKVPIL